MLATLYSVGRTDPRLPYHLGRDLAGRTRVDYGFVATIDREIRRDPEREHLRLGLGKTRDEIYTRLDNEQSQRQLLAGRLNMLFRDRRAHAYTRHQMETEASNPERLGVIDGFEYLAAKSDAVIIGTGDLTTGTGDSTTGTGYRTTGTAGTREGPAQPELPEEAELVPKRATRSTPVTTTPAPTATTTTSVTNAQLQEMIDQGVTAALAARDANRTGDDSHTSGTGGRRTERVVRECTYQDFMKCKPLYFKGTEGVVQPTFQELALCVVRMFLEESNERLKGVREIPTMLTIRGALVRPKIYLLRVWSLRTLQEGTSKDEDNKTMETIVIQALNKMYAVVPCEGKTQLRERRGTGTYLLNNRHAFILHGILVPYHAIIVCAKKIVRIPWGNETLIVHGDGSNQGHEARLHIISYSKTQEYMLKGCPVFLAHVTTKEVEDKSEKKRLEDVPIVRDFPEVFPEDLPGLPLTRQVEFQIDLIPGAHRSSCRLID
ncbi:hypothetical protein Tco_0712457 [Tanacetum coccineum]